MGTIVSRKRRDGTVAYTAQVRIKRGGKVIHSEAQTFNRKSAASAWLKKRETELAQPGVINALNAPDPALREAIDQYVKESTVRLGKTKAQVLRTIKTYDLADMRCSEITSSDIVAFAQSLTSKPQTVKNYLSHLSSIFAIARPAWGYPLSYEAMQDARTVCARLGLTANSTRRDRRPTMEELDRLMTHFGFIRSKRKDSNPMQALVAFAIYSTRRQEEITLLRWDDFEDDRILVRDMKHPGDKWGNDQWTELTPEASAIIKAQPRTGERIFPCSTDAIGAAFTRACRVLQIEDLRFHDLRHHGVSRLFEMGKTIPQVASVSAHRSWDSLRRYTHLRHTGDCMEGWKWLPAVTGQPVTA